jgi:TM2 domain-containing membrane protein YozV
LGQHPLQSGHYKNAAPRLTLARRIQREEEARFSILGADSTEAFYRGQLQVCLTNSALLPSMIEMSVEYTDAPTVRSEPGTGDKMACPYCGHLLPKDATKCDRCDWTRGASETAEGKASDAVAVIFSIIPGLGHIYKGHKFAGFLWMFGAIPVGIFVLLAAFASAGWGLGLFFFYLIAVMLHAYAVDDRVAPPKEDEGEEY